MVGSVTYLLFSRIPPRYSFFRPYTRTASSTAIFFASQSCTSTIGAAGITSPSPHRRLTPDDAADWPRRVSFFLVFLLGREGDPLRSRDRSP